MVVDDAHKHVFVTGGYNDSVIDVVDFNGNLVTTIANEPGAAGMVLDAPTHTLYVALAGQGMVDKIDTKATPPVKTGSISVDPATPLTGPIGAAAGRLWFGYGAMCQQFQGGIASMDPASSPPDVKTYSVEGLTDVYCPAVATTSGNPNLLLSWERGLSPPVIRAYDLSTDPPTLVTSQNELDLADPRQVAFNPAATRFYTAAGSPYEIDTFKVSTLKQTMPTCPADSYPSSVVTTLNGKHLATGLSSQRQGVWVFKLGSDTCQLIAKFDVGSSDMYDKGIAFTADESRLFAVTGAFTGFANFHVIRKPTNPGSRKQDDFNGDGIADVAVGVPGEDNATGAVNVIYGSQTGLTSTSNQMLREGIGGVPGPAGTNDYFGFAVAAGDFNNDRFTDLAIGIPGKNTAAGAVDVLYGSLAGLSATGAQQWAQGAQGILGTPEANDQFGISLSARDFNGDGYIDLAVGVNQDKVGSLVGAGAVNVMYGSSSGLSATNNQLWNLDSSGITGTAAAGDAFGNSVAAGDFNGDGFSDLATGIPGKKLGTINAAGATSVMYGSSTGLTPSGNRLWTQNSSGVLDQAEANDVFGWVVSAGDFNGDGTSDLAVGARLEDIGTKKDAGGVNVIYGSSGGLTATGNQFWNQDSAGIVNAAEAADVFGFALATGDANGDGKDDLAVGVPGEDFGSIVDSGSVNIIYGSGTGLAATGNQQWDQDSSGVLDQNEKYDYFGYSVFMADIGNGSPADLVIGVPNESLLGEPGAGAINVLYGSAGRLTATANQFWYQGENGILDMPELNDNFGFGLAQGTGGAAATSAEATTLTHWQLER
jgi:hypothetical protein